MGPGVATPLVGRVHGIRKGIQLDVQWNPSITDTIGTHNIVPNSVASGIFPVGVVLLDVVP